MARTASDKKKNALLGLDGLTAAETTGRSCQPHLPECSCVTIQPISDTGRCFVGESGEVVVVGSAGIFGETTRTLVMLATKTNQCKLLYAYALRRNNEVVHHSKTSHTETLQKDITLFLTRSGGETHHPKRLG